MRRLKTMLAVVAAMALMIAAAAPAMADVRMSVGDGWQDYDIDDHYYVYDNDDDERYGFFPGGYIEYEYEDGRWVADDVELYSYGDYGYLYAVPYWLPYEYWYY